ncbi:WD40 repeat-like protein [Mycena metata]|uniref:WD40 repeat-like protein n=1 Tax=Mycena metata TaxID=1033252 RepID=A0AAD7IB12_9AGAR|nr:WD40 repeat-like protein [Mycena metata]
MDKEVEITPTPLVRAIDIYDARCEITSDSIAHPIAMTNNGTCLLLSSMGGYKNRSPVLTYYLLDDTTPRSPSSRILQFPLQARHAEVGLTDIAWASTTDESNKLLFVADKGRAKSTTVPYTSSPPGRVLRAGTGSVAVWDLDTLETHGPDGDRRVGRKFDTSDSWRDEDDELELNSAGSKPTSVLALADARLAPSLTLGSRPTGGARIRVCRGRCSVGATSLNHTTLRSWRWIWSTGGGHASEPNVFATAASDGHARLYDQRTPLPVLTVRAGSGEEYCGGGVVLAHPDGVPSIFTGATEDEVIRLWDSVRARKMVYELSTGNNVVSGMTWDEPRSILYVSTVCEYIDRQGENFDYRRAKVPKEQKVRGGLDAMMEDEDDWDDEAPCWPKRAAHAEDYFGHLFDAGDHRILRYAFKEHPDSSVLPEYGDARLDMDPSW